jgi:SHS2 domain-containing protein
MPYEIVEHKADVGLHVSGRDLARLFTDAARGMFFIISEQPPEGWPESHAVELEAVDIEQLLVDWLAELLYLFEVKKFFPLDAEIEEIGPGRIKAAVSGLRTRGAFADTEIKAVTHHLLSVDKTLNGYETTIYFDL